jgi:hypothetical protein
MSHQQKISKKNIKKSDVVVTSREHNFSGKIPKKTGGCL